MSSCGRMKKQSPKASKPQSAPSCGSICIRSYKDDEPCGGHQCCACGRTFYCGERHECPPRPERAEVGVARRQTFAERLSEGMKMRAFNE